MYDKRFNNLLWITPNYSQSPKNEIELIKKTIQIVKNDSKKKMLITHYQFLQSITKKKLNYPNRTYTTDGVSMPHRKNENYEHIKIQKYKDMKNNK